MQEAERRAFAQPAEVRELPRGRAEIVKVGNWFDAGNDATQTSSQ